VVPLRAILLFERTSSPAADVRVARRASCSSIKGQQADRLRLGEQLDQQPPQPDRL